MDGRVFMRKELLLFSLGICFFFITPVALSALRPVATLSVGEDSAKTKLNQNVMLIPPFQDTYASSNATMQPVAGLFLGGEMAILKEILGQLGVGYYQSNAFTIKGNVSQFADPAMNNLSYQYYVSNKRFLLEGKLLATFQKKLHPFIIGGIGEAINKAYRYVEMPVDSDDVPMAQGFNNRIYHALTYEIGLGFDININDHVRCGAAYRFVDLGKVGLGTTPLQNSTQTITYNHLHMNEFLVQLSYVG